ncbi:hypothetical protein F2P81_008962 [Scophthalmus maximus]|uniref:Uncharacterized protein n=1 Tax=Scophthalmus maximus TaxID=52904 RepID=A0A6A4T2B8_SCOMX|nr:hypothetical protein F2P81_008962 [Scophthalmus maximus]
MEEGSREGREIRVHVEGTKSSKVMRVTACKPVRRTMAATDIRSAQVESAVCCPDAMLLSDSVFHKRHHHSSVPHIYFYLLRGPCQNISKLDVTLSTSVPSFAHDTGPIRQLIILKSSADIQNISTVPALVSDGFTRSQCLHMKRALLIGDRFLCKFRSTLPHQEFAENNNSMEQKREKDMNNKWTIMGIALSDEQLRFSAELSPIRKNFETKFAVCQCFMFEPDIDPAAPDARAVMTSVFAQKMLCVHPANYGSNNNVDISSIFVCFLESPKICDQMAKNWCYHEERYEKDFSLKGNWLVSGFASCQILRREQMREQARHITDQMTAAGGPREQLVVAEEINHNI